jgi:hypothetical protein
MLALADEDPDQQVWVPAACLTQAHLELAGSGADEILDALFAADREINISVLGVDSARRIGRVGARFGFGMDTAHAVDTAVLTRCFIVTAQPRLIEPTGLELLDINEIWD